MPGFETINHKELNQLKKIFTVGKKAVKNLIEDHIITKRDIK